MQEDLQKPASYKTGKRAGIWLALALALALHGVILLLPVVGNAPVETGRQRAVEIQLTTAATTPADERVEQTVTEAQAAEPVPEAVPPPPETVMERQAEALKADTPPAPPARKIVARPLIRELDNLSQPEKDVLTNTILLRQFITEESVVDQLFGKPLAADSAEIRKEFHYPLRPDLIEMLDRPLPDVPFAYTPGLVYFAYEPGVKGDLQRFWDVITPEFGWRTKYGTEVRCGLILIIVGCAWK